MHDAPSLCNAAEATRPRRTSTPDAESPNARTSGAGTCGTLTLNRIDSPCRRGTRGINLDQSKPALYAQRLL